MRLTHEQLDEYYDKGVLIIPDKFTAEECSMMRRELRNLAKPGIPGVVLEENGLVRALHGCHMQSNIFEGLTHHAHMLEPVLQILNTDVYVHQFKINMKLAFGGELWPWHQDYIFWKYEDGMPESHVVNIAVFLDDITEFNGPLFLLPRSHHLGLVEVEAKAPHQNEEDWMNNVSADLRYTVPNQIVAAEEAKNGMVSATGKAGSIMLFHPNTIHGSCPNISPRDRELLVITYNSVDNIPHFPRNPRPEFLAGHNFKPLKVHRNPWE